MLINTTEGKESIQDSSSIRRTALDNKIPCTTTLQGGLAIYEVLEKDLIGPSKTFKIFIKVLNKIEQRANDSRGEESLRTELQHLITDVRKHYQKIAEAREFGDLKENAEYHAAKEQQGLTEARIREIEGKLSASQIIDIKKLNAQEELFLDLRYHSWICKTIKNQLSNCRRDEANVKNGKISYSSPLARSLIGKEEGEATKFESPSGIKEYEILEVSHI